MTADPFSDILRLAEPETMLTGGFVAGGDWALRFPAPGAIKFFAVTKGMCFVSIEGREEPIRFGTGDVGLLVAKRAYTLASDPSVAPVEAMDIFSRAGRTFATLGDGADFAHLGGHVLLDPTSGNLLAEALPPWLRIPADHPAACRIGWLLQEMQTERDRVQPGHSLASSHLAQLLFIEILRTHIDGTERMPPGWLRVLADDRLAPAVRLMHGDPACEWSLAELAKACAMSRSTFAARFAAAAGIAPLGYLARWRMHLAQRALAKGELPVASIAREIGYSSQSAFSNAFKRVTGQSPRAWRIGRGGAPA